MRPVFSLLWLTALLSLGTHLVAADSDVHMANGIKIGEVDAQSAIIWTRLTQHPERNIEGQPWDDDPKLRNVVTPPPKPISEMEGSAMGAVGEVRLTYWATGSQATQPQATEWKAVNPGRDFIHQFKLKDLTSGTSYRIVAEGRPQGSDEPTCRVEGSFQTAPAADKPSRICFTLTTCGDYPRRDDKDNGHKIYPAMKKLEPQFMINAGDILYYDKPGPFANTVPLARFKWNRLYSMPFQRAFHNTTASYFMKDDHETLKNDCWPGQTYGDLTWDDGLAIFREQVPMGDLTYRTVRWGQDLQIWLVEGRDFRSPNTMPDGPEKTIWGKEQKQWFYDTVAKSDAAFQLLISPTPIVGPDRGNKNDNLANKGFTHEGDEIRSFIGKHKNMFVICGDRHWQYASVDHKTGVREFSIGPASDQHAGGWKNDLKMKEHLYLNVTGGFLSVIVERVDGQPRITFRHHDVEGALNNEIIHQLEE
jgi:alkaline phosphatase D